MKNFEIRKGQILQGITNLFFQKGYEGTSIRDISRVLGITNPGLYYYFKTKQEMLFTIINDIIERALLDLEKKGNTIQNPEDKISWIIENHINFYLRHTKQTKVLVQERRFLQGKYAKIVSEKERKYVSLIKKAVTELIEKTNVEININVATFSLLGMLTWVVRWYDVDGKVTPKALARNMSRIFLKGLTG